MIAADFVEPPASETVFFSSGGGPSPT